MTSHPKGASEKLAPFFISGFLLLAILSPTLSHAGAPVVEIQDRGEATPVRANPASTAAKTPSMAAQANPAAENQSGQFGDLFIQVQQLQHEVQDLRGIIEQQNFAIQTLQQQVKDNYIDLDKRLGALKTSTASPASPAATTNSVSEPTTTATAETTTPAVNTDAEKDSYDAAYKLLDQNKRDEAVAAFLKHLSTYPKGEYAANACYWLGQIYLTQGQLAPAEEQFNTLLKNFPDHRKVPDAKFALGKVYFQEGKKAEAQKIIQEVAQGNSKTAALAKSFLQDNF
jgi:tol-pal system protein YbgF